MAKKKSKKISKATRKRLTKCCRAKISGKGKGREKKIRACVKRSAKKAA